MSRDPESLKVWYRQAMVRRIHELRALRVRLAAADPAAGDATRKLAQHLRGSGGTFGFSELSEAAAMVESARDEQLQRRVEGLLEVLFRVSAPGAGGRAVRAEWLVLAAGLPPDGAPFADIAVAWDAVARRSGLAPQALARRAAAKLRLRVADPGRASRSALRFVPEALLRREFVVPLAEESATITVASADPTSLALEQELARLTGRAPVFVLAPPEAVGRALDEMLAAPAPPSPLRRAPCAVPDTDDASGASRVLVVDDDPDARVLARAVLETRGYEVLEAADGVEALQRLRHDGPVALVVADLDMPRMNGRELLWALRRSPTGGDLPLLVLTAAADPSLEAKLIEEGADDYLSKPLDPGLFLARVRAILRRARA